MSDKAARMVARAAVAMAGRSFDSRARPLEVAIVTGTKPLSADLVGTSVTLDDYTLLLGAWARTYDQKYGFKKGDSLLVQSVASGDYVVLDVVTKSDVLSGSGPIADLLDSDDPTYSGSDPQGGTVTVTPSHHIISKVPYYDIDGTRLGWIPIYNTLPGDPGPPTP